MQVEEVVEASRDEDEFVPLLELLREQKQDLVAIQSSTSWRLTAPLRRVLDFVRGRKST